MALSNLARLLDRAEAVVALLSLCRFLSSWLELGTFRFIWRKCSLTGVGICCDKQRTSRFEIVLLGLYFRR
jgi:hypothetical protein